MLLSFTPLGEFRANTFNTGNQSDASVAVDKQGDFVIVWQSYAQDGSGFGIFAQRYNAAGLPQGGEFQVNTYTAGDQVSPRAAMDDQGNFVIVWASFGEDGSGFGIYGQRYNSFGLAQGGEFQVNTTTVSDQISPAVAMNGAGAFVVTWQSFDPSSQSWGIYEQRYDARGAAQGTESPVGASVGGDHRVPSVGIDAGGDYIIAWENITKGGSDVFGQRINALGIAQGDVFQVNAPGGGDAYSPAAAMNGQGALVIAFQRFVSSPPSFSDAISIQAYNVLGTPLYSTPFDVTPLASNVSNIRPSVTMDPEGDYLVAYQNLGSEGTLLQSGAIFAQGFAKTGAIAGPLLQLDTAPNGMPIAPVVAMDAAGDFVAAWSSYSLDRAGFGVYGQRFVGSSFAVQLPLAIAAGAPEDLRVTAVDSFGNIATQYTGKAIIGSSDLQAKLPATYQFVAADQGGHTFAGGLTLNDEGFQTVKVADAINPVMTGSKALLVTPLAPKISAAAGITFLSVGTPFTSSGEFVDPGLETWAATVDYGDGAGAQPLTLHADKSFALDHLYNQEGSYNVTITVTDSDGDAGIGTLVVNVLPGTASEEAVQAVLPGQTETITETHSAATLHRSPTAQGDALLVLASLTTDAAAALPAEPDLPPARELAAFDLRLLNADPGDVATITFRYPAADAVIPILEYVDPVSHTVRAVHPSAESPDALVLDRVQHTLTLTLDRTSVPAITDLKGTVFTVSVAVTNETSTAIAASIAQASAGGGATTDAPATQGFIQTTSFQSTSQLTLALSATQGLNAPSSNSGMGEGLRPVDAEEAAWLRMLQDILGDDSPLSLMFDTAPPTSTWTRDPRPQPAASPTPSHETGAGAQSRNDIRDVLFVQRFGVENEYVELSIQPRTTGTEPALLAVELAADRAPYDASSILGVALACLARVASRPAQRAADSTTPRRRSRCYSF